MGVDEALKQLLAGIEPLAPVSVPLDQAQGLVLAQSLVAQESHPAEDTSAMDGYAVMAEALETASAERPVRLPVGEDIRAGFPPERPVPPGQCARISTGGLMPDGADSVEMREYVEVVDGHAVFTRPVPSGVNVRRAGEHLSEGDEVLTQGTRLGPSQLGMAAHLGYLSPLCYPRLRVAILATGSELVRGEQDLARGQIRDSNGIALAASARELGCEISVQDGVTDDAAALDAAIDRALGCSEVLLTSGGISAGWHDLVRDRIENSGGSFVFHKLRMRPGKPVAFGKIGPMWVFCLPGNPVSSLVTFEIFVKPALLKLMGRSFAPHIVQATLAEPVQKKKGFTVYFRVALQTSEQGQLLARLSGPQESHQLKTLVQADGLMVAREPIEELPAGSLVDVQLFS